MKFNMEAAIKGAVVEACFDVTKKVRGRAVFHKGDAIVVDFETYGITVINRLGAARINGYYATCSIVPVVRYLNLYEDNTPAIFLNEESAKAAGEIKHKTKGFPIVVAQRIESEF